jgi:ankyrin repeat protein
LDLRQNALRGGDYGPVIKIGDSAGSKLIRRVVDGDGGLQMPPTGALSNDEIGLLRAWIDQGAEFRTDIVAEAPRRPVDPKVMALVGAVRTGNRSEIEQLIAASPELISGKDAGGSTALHHAAGYGPLDNLQLLIDKGADVNAKNRRGSTPLHWAIHDEAKVRLLLAKGANVNARQAQGRTPLCLAAMLGNGVPTVRLLLSKGADPNLATVNGQTPLMTAARGKVEAMQLLIEKGADVNAKDGAGETALMFASTSGNARAVQLLIERGADVKVTSKRNETALGFAATSGVQASVEMLLAKGADVNVRNFRGYSPLMFAASSDAMPAGIIKLLLAKGADTSFTGDYDEPASALAAKRGHTEAARLLGAASPSPSATATAMVTPVSLSHRPISGAVISSLALLEKQSDKFIRTAGCNSCHSQSLPSAAAGLARDFGLTSMKSFPRLPATMTPPAEQIMDFNVISANSVAWELFDAGMNHEPRTQVTDAIVRYIMASQTAEGSWQTPENRRPPMTSGTFQTAALAIYAIKNYAPEVEKLNGDKAIARAVAWLEKATPVTNQDHALRLLGLAWGGGSVAVIHSEAKSLAALQRADGGWNQLPAMSSDAYATGEALFALGSAGRMAVSDPVFRKGVEYLLTTQADDGSWHVKSRSIWLQPYLESGFPYGQDQFISTAGTGWATLALTLAAEPGKQAQRR